MRNCLSKTNLLVAGQGRNLFWPVNGLDPTSPGVGQEIFVLLRNCRRCAIGARRHSKQLYQMRAAVCVVRDENGLHAFRRNHASRRHRAFLSINATNSGSVTLAMPLEKTSACVRRMVGSPCPGSPRSRSVL